MTDREIADKLRNEGWGVVPPDQYLIDVEPEFRSLWEEVEAFTMTYVERGYALFKAVEYVCRNNVPGDLVECGVWRGGSCMLIAKALQLFGDPGRQLHLYDTFAGMTEPTEEDVIAWNDLSVADRMKRRPESFDSWSVGLEEVRGNMEATGYDVEKIQFIEGDICRTLADHTPESIALLRLDTDWYESTRAELEILYPRLVSGGILVIDDYGHFKGARKAVDEYFRSAGYFPYLSRSDYTGRTMVKP